MAIELFTGTQAECNAIISKVNTALGYTGTTSICVPYAIDSTNDIYEVVIFTGTQKNALSTSEKTKVAATRSFENEDKERAKKLTFIESHSDIPFKKITSLTLRTPKGAVLTSDGGTIRIDAIIKPTDASEKTKFHWSIDSNFATLQDTTGTSCVVTSQPKSRGRTITIKCNTTDGSRVFGSIQLTIG